MRPEPTATPDPVSSPAVSRRTLLRLSGVLIAGVTATGLAACGAAATTSVTTSAATATTATTPAEIAGRGRAGTRVNGTTGRSGNVTMSRTSDSRCR